MSDVFSFDFLTAELNQLKEEYFSRAVLPKVSTVRVSYFKQFLRNLVENLAHNSDGSLFSVVRISSLYPAEVTDMAMSDYWKGVVMRRAFISEEVMKKWSLLLTAVRAPAKERDYDTYPEILGYFRFYVQKMVDELRDSHRTDPCDVVAVMRVAAMYPANIQEMACTRWRQSVMQRGAVDESVMQIWACMVESTRTAELKPGADEHTTKSIKCAGLLMDVLESVLLVEEFPSVMRYFPIDVVYTMLITMRPQFRVRFPFIGDTEVVWHSVVKEWASTVRGRYEDIHIQASLLCALRMKLVSRNKMLEGESELKITDFRAQSGCSSGRAVNLSRILFDPEYAKAYNLAKKKHVRSNTSILSELFKKVTVSRVTALVCKHKAVAVALLGLKLVEQTRKIVLVMDLSTVSERKRQIYARFLRLVARLDQDHTNWEEKLATASAALSSIMASAKA